MSSSTEFTVLSEFECPVCMEYMSPPIHQCTMGHIFCVSCFDKFVRCPTCRSPKGVSRAYALERIHSSLYFPCKYKSDGCDAQVPGTTLKEHHDICEFAKNPCPFARAMQCKWSGQKIEVMNHLKEDHPGNIHNGNHIILKCPMFDLLGQQSAFYFTIIQAYGEKFEFCWNLSPKGIMKWSVYFLGEPSERKRYKYEILVGKPHGDYEPICLSTNCEGMVDELELFEDKNCLMSNFESTKKRCNKNGDLHYEVRVIDKAFSSLKNV